MDNIIPIHEGQYPVNARDLHEFLQVGKDYTTWIRDRIYQYGFLKGLDWQVFPETGENPIGGRPTLVFEITLSMAKELSMVERNERGQQARRYFIACEEKLKAIVAQPLSQIQALQQAVNLLAEQDRRLRELEESRDQLEGIVQDTHQQAHHLEARLRDVQQGLVDINEPLRHQFNDAIRDYAKRHNIDFRIAYNNVYDTLDAQEHIDIRTRARHKGIPAVAIVEELRLLPRATQLAKSL